MTKTGGQTSAMDVQNVQNHVYQPPATLLPISYLQGASCKSGYVYPACLTIALF